MARRRNAHEYAPWTDEFFQWVQSRHDDGGQSTPDDALIWSRLTEALLQHLGTPLRNFDRAMAVFSDDEGVLFVDHMGAKAIARLWKTDLREMRDSGHLFDGQITISR